MRSLLYYLEYYWIKRIANLNICPSSLNNNYFRLNYYEDDYPGNLNQLQHYAVEKVHVDVTKVLLEYNASGYLKDASEKTALQLAEENGHKIVENLITGLVTKVNL